MPWWSLPVLWWGAVWPLLMWALLVCLWKQRNSTNRRNRILNSRPNLHYLVCTGDLRKLNYELFISWTCLLVKYTIDSCCWSSVTSFQQILGMSWTLNSLLAKRCCWFGGRKGIRPVKTEWWGTGVVICLEQGADYLHMVQLMQLPPHHRLLQ